ncbi:uncharacterized protein LOC132459132 [Gadus macrocephalus]|uniref:uncharacterized protein LOC132459132 n=1 Tax=Gadus macrocephalus TaxID=80720 RepID=UPI0028CB5AC5|nr:uncharacterized protein LOC132459132 [Gadus macrocephalus]
MLKYMFELKEDSVKNMERSITILLLWCHLQGVGGQSWTVSLPQSVKGLQGSCVRIPCNFTLERGWDTDLDHACKAQWFKDFRKDPVFDSSLDGDRNLYQGDLEGNLLNRDCTTVFHNLPAFKSKLFFKINCQSSLKYKFTTAVVVDVKDAWRPVLNPKGQVEVVEGRPVMLSCSAPILCPYRPTLSWTPSLGDTQETVEDELVTSVLTFNASPLHRGQRITCSSLYKRHTGLSNASFEQYLTINFLCESKSQSPNVVVDGSIQQCSLQTTPPRILPSSGCSRIAAWVRCSCYSEGRPSPSLEWRLDGKLVSGSEDVSVSQVNLDNTTSWSALTIKALPGPTALTCHSSNAVGNTSQKLPVSHLDTQPNLTDVVLCTVKSAVMFVGLVCVVVCIIRTRKVGEETRSFNAATVKRAPPDEEESQVVFGGEGDIYINNGMQMNPEPVVEGTPVELGCSARSYCDTHPPTVTWTPALGLSTQLQQGDTVTSTLTFNASHLHHGNNVSCTAAFYIPSGNKTSDAPRNTSAVGSPCLPAREGGCLNLTCSSHANPAVSEFTWYRIHGEHILKIGSGSSLSIQLWNANNVYFCEVRNDIGTEKSNVYKIDIQTPPRILPSSACSRIAPWVRCSCDSVGRPSPSLEWRLDGKLVSGSEDVSVSQVNLENATLRSSLTMRAPAGLTALTCHSSNAAGNTSQELPVPHLDTQPTLTEQLPWIAATAVLAAGLLFATACAVRAWKMATRTRLGSDGLLNKAPPNQGNSKVFFRSGEDIYANIDTLMNTVGPREDPVGAGEEAVGLGEGAVGLGEGAVGLGEGAVGLGEGAVGLGEGAVGLGGGAVGLGEGAVGLGEGADCDVLYTTVKWKKKS